MDIELRELNVQIRYLIVMLQSFPSAQHKALFFSSFSSNERLSYVLGEEMIEFRVKMYDVPIQIFFLYIETQAISHVFFSFDFQFSSIAQPAVNRN